MPLRDYQLGEILPANGGFSAENPNHGDMLVDVAAGEGFSGEIIATKGEFQFELVSKERGDVLVRHEKAGLVGVYLDNSLGVREAWSRRGLGVALLLYGYDHGKTPSSDRQFTTAGAAAMTKAMKVANEDDVNPYWP